jgi:hypothetical protein
VEIFGWVHACRGAQRGFRELTVVILVVSNSARL